MTAGAKMTNATSAETLASLAEIVHQVVAVPVEQVLPSALFIEDLGVDSLSLLEIAVGIEEKFGAAIPDGDLSSMLRVSDALAFIEGSVQA
jgi:acyl carrier protein